MASQLPVHRVDPRLGIARLRD